MRAGALSYSDYLIRRLIVSIKMLWFGLRLLPDLRYSA